MTNSPTPRQRELAQLGTAIQRGNFNAQTLRRFRELVADEARPQIDAALQRATARLAELQALFNKQRYGAEGAVPVPYDRVENATLDVENCKRRLAELQQVKK
jgi:hypothetical protein